MSEVEIIGLKTRVFFALWPDDATRAALANSGRDIVESSEGRAVPDANLHVTLAFLGEVTAGEFLALRRIKPPRVGAFELSIGEAGLRKRAQLLWAAPRDVPPALLALEAGLWERVEEIGIERDRRAYLPHVTLARRARRALGVFECVDWLVREIALVESRLGPPHSTYTVIETFPL